MTKCPVPRLLMIGIDGADYLITRRLFAEGLLPNLLALAESGAWGPIRSTVPPTTPPAWTTMMTGKNPGKHGVYDFLPMSGDTMETPIAARRRAATIWRALSDAGLRVGTYNLPATYPPEALSGFQVAGFDAPRFQPSLALPEEAFAVVRASVGEYELCPFSIQDPGGNPEALQQHADLPVLGSRALLKAFPCDVYMVSFQIVDWVHHGSLGHEMKAGDPTSLDLGGAVVQTYQLVDDRIGALLEEWVSDETSVAVVSDHGGTSADRLVNLEKLFLDVGLMAYTSVPGAGHGTLERRRARARSALRAWTWLKRSVPPLAGLVRPLARAVRQQVSSYQQDLQIDWPRTKATPWGEFGQVRLNLEGRDPTGSVPAGNRDALETEIRDLLLALRDPETGQSVYTEVRTNEEVYDGPFAGVGPDLVAIPREERYLTVTARAGCQPLPLLDVQTEPVTVLEPAWGTHSSSGILLMTGPDIAAGRRFEEAALADVVPTLLYLLDEPVPEDLDGRPLNEAFEAETVTTRPVRRREPWPEPKAIGGDGRYSEEERRQVENRLRSLGYM